MRVSVFVCVCKRDVKAGQTQSTPLLIHTFPPGTPILDGGGGSGKLQKGSTPFNPFAARWLFVRWKTARCILNGLCRTASSFPPSSLSFFFILTVPCLHLFQIHLLQILLQIQNSLFFKLLFRISSSSFLFYRENASIHSLMRSSSVAHVSSISAKQSVQARNSRMLTCASSPVPCG